MREVVYGDDYANGEGEAVPFQVSEPIELGSLEDVKDERPHMPPTSDVLVRVKEVKTIGKDAKKWYGIDVTLVVEDGITDDSGETKFKNFHLRSGPICLFADASQYSGNYAERIQKKQHLIDLRRFLEAVGKDITNVKINDEFLASLKGERLVVNVGQKTNSEGEIENVVSRFRAVDQGQMV